MTAEGGLSDYIEGGSVLGGAEPRHWAAGVILLLIVFALYYWRATIQQWWKPAGPGTFRAMLAARRRLQTD